MAFIDEIDLPKQLSKFLYGLTSPNVPLSDKAKCEAGELNDKIKTAVILTDLYESANRSYGLWVLGSKRKPPEGHIVFLRIGEDECPNIGFVVSTYGGLVFETIRDGEFYQLNECMWLEEY